MDWWHHDLSTGGAIVMGIMMLVFWAMLAVAIVWLVRAVVAGPTTGADVAPRAVLDRRLAEGEISLAEYRELRAALEDESVGLRS